MPDAAVRIEQLLAELSWPEKLARLQIGYRPRLDDARELVRAGIGAVLSAQCSGDSMTSVLGELPCGSDVMLELRVEPSSGSMFSTELGPDEIVAGVVGEEGFVELGSIDGRYISTEVAGGMTGRMVGLVCTRGEVLVRSSTYAGSDDPGAKLAATGDSSGTARVR